MAVSLIAIANGNLTTNTTWGTSNAGALNITGSTSVGITASYVSSSTFTPGAVTIDGIAVYVNTRPGSSGTLSIALDQGGSTVVGTEVTINVTDIPAAGSTWIMTQFTGVLLAAATLYSVKIKASGTSLVTCFTTSGNNWLRQLRVPGTIATPGAGDSMYIFGEKTGAGAQTTRTVTMDDAAAGATVYGVMDINSGGTLTYGTTGGVNYYMKLAGNCNVRSGGTLKIGDAAGTRIPSNSTADLKFSNSVNVDFGLVGIGSPTIITGGNNNANPWALLAADASASATSLTTDRSTGWKNTDVIALASTTATASQCESKALTADASGTTLTITALTNAHGGNTTTLVTAELANLSRNVRISGTSTSLQAYAVFPAAATVTLDDCEFFNMGSNTSGKRGLNVQTTTGSFVANYCSIHDFIVAGSLGFYADSASGANISLNHSVLYNCATNLLNVSAPTGAAGVTLNDVVAIRTTNGVGAGIGYSNSVTNLRVAGSTDSAIQFTGGSAALGTFSGLVAHSATGTCVEFLASSAGQSSAFTITNLTAWRGTLECILFNSVNEITGATFNTLTCFGGGTANIVVTTRASGITITNATIRAGTTIVSPIGISFSAQTYYDFTIVNSVFGGGGETHSSGDISIAVATIMAIVYLDNCTLNSSTQIQAPSNLVYNQPPHACIRANFLGATVAHKTWVATGTWSYDSTIFVVSPSLRLTPTSATLKLQSPSFYSGVASGHSITASVAVRTSLVASGDSQTYNGNAPRLIVRRNYGAGITSDTVLATATGASSGAFETISGTTAAVSNNCALEFFVDCDGTQGWVNVDSVSMTQV